MHRAAARAIVLLPFAATWCICDSFFPRRRAPQIAFEIRSRMSASASRPWWPADSESAAALALSLRETGAVQPFFELCAGAAASHDWSIFNSAMAALCDVGLRSICNMVETAKFDSGWAILYGQTGMPAEFYPLFTEFLKSARKIQLDGPATRAQRRAVLQHAMASPDLRGLKLPADLKAALLS